MERGKVQRGFKAFRNKVKGNNSSLRNIRECSTCKSMFKARGEDEEVCHDSNVTKYDMTVEESGKTYCTYWRPNWSE